MVLPSLFQVAVVFSLCEIRVLLGQNQTEIPRIPPVIPPVIPPGVQPPDNIDPRNQTVNPPPEVINPRNITPPDFRVLLGPTEAALRKNLFERQINNPMIRPVTSPSDVMNVSFGIKLNSLEEVRNKEQLVTTEVWVEQVWVNPSLAWNKSQYGGLDHIYVDPTKVWVPDTVLYNNGNDLVVMAGHLTLFKTFVIVYSNGTSRWMSPASFISSCPINVKKFPFDRQVCELEFGSWTMDIKNLEFTPINTRNNVEEDSGDWVIESFDVKKKEIRYECCPEPFSVIVYTLKINRKPVFYGLFLILPCLIIGGLILATFFLPPENGERLGLCSTILLAVSVYLLIVSELLPEKSDTLPLIGVYFIITMLEISLVLVATIFVLKAYHATSRPPRFLQIFALRFKKLQEYKVFKKAKYNIGSAHSSNVNKGLDEEMATAEKDRSKEDPVSVEVQAPKAVTESPADVIARALQDEREENERRDAWRDISIALDRLFFWLFTAMFVFSTFIVYSQT